MIIINNNVIFIAELFNELTPNPQSAYTLYYYIAPSEIIL